MHLPDARRKDRRHAQPQSGVHEDAAGQPLHRHGNGAANEGVHPDCRGAQLRVGTVEQPIQQVLVQART